MADPFEVNPVHSESSKGAHNLASTELDGEDLFPKIRPEFAEHQNRSSKGKHSEKPDEDDDARDTNLTVLDWFKECGKSFTHASVENSINGLGQLVDESADRKLIPDVEIFTPSEEARTGTERWYAQTIGAGVGSVLPFLATELVTKRLGDTEVFASARSFADSLPVARSIMGLEHSSKFLAPLTKSALNGGIYGFALMPADDLHNDFWRQRSINGLSALICFGTQYGIANATMSGIEKAGIGHMHFSPGSRLDAKTFVTHVGSNLLGGIGAGAVGAESYSLMSNQGFASKELLKDSVAKFALTSVGLDSLHLGGMVAAHKIIGAAKPDAHAESSQADSSKPAVVVAVGEVESRVEPSDESRYR